MGGCVETATVMETAVAVHVYCTSLEPSLSLPLPFPPPRFALRALANQAGDFDSASKYFGSVYSGGAGRVVAHGDAGTLMGVAAGNAKLSEHLTALISTLGVPPS